MARKSTGEGKHSSMVTSTGYCYSDVSAVGNNHHHQQNLQSHQLMMNQLQSFESNPDDHIFNLSTTGMDMAAAGFFGGKPPATGHQHQGGGPSSSKTTINESSGVFYGHPQHFNNNSTASESLMVAAAAGYHGVEDDSSMRCVFPCEGNERPSQGLSLSLSSTNPSTIGLQTFELRQPDHHGYFGKSTVTVQDGFWGKSSAAAAGHILQQHVNHGQFFQIRSSKYLGPAQELLNEFCNLGTKQTDHKPKTKAAQPHNTSTSQWLLQDHEDHQENTASTSSKKQQQPLCNLELLELQKRKTKLLSMLEEVDRRYRHYCDQMKTVVATFETVAGEGAAKVYSALASKAMSRHFRCLRDGIVGQIKTTKQAMGEKDTATPGTTRGETPRLRLLDQTLRQQRAFQQMTMMETHPWRPQRGLPERSVSVLRAWLFEHFLHPYPSDVDKHILARQTGLSRSQVSNWFINARVRLWKPMVEEMYVEETKEHDNLASSDDNNIGRPSGQIQNSQTRPEDEKPTPDQLVRRDSDCLSSVINNDPKNSKSPRNMPHHQQQQQQQTFGRVADAFGAAMELDFSSYNHQTAGAVSYANENAHQNFGGGGGGGVSLTLGLQQHGGSGGVSLAFSTPFGADMEDCQPVQYSLLDGETQNLPYRNLMGAQLLHDLAG